MLKKAASIIEQALGVPTTRLLGCGYNGCAFMLEDGTVGKYTENELEAECSELILKNKSWELTDALPIVEKVVHTAPFVWVIKKEYLENITFAELADIARERNGDRSLNDVLDMFSEEINSIRYIGLRIVDAASLDNWGRRPYTNDIVFRDLMCFKPTNVQLAE